jgi:predicted AlkP superfamily pyrophosphatase or phosphodiesterase
MIKEFLTLSVISLSTSLFCQESARIPSDKPKLIIGIEINQFRYDYIPRFWNKLSEDGFKKLIGRGSYCENTSYNYLSSDLGVGSATIATGTNPSQHGIVASSWYNNLKDEIEDYILDPEVKTIGGGFEVGQYSPKNLMVSTYADEIKIANNFKSKIISISLDPAPSIFSTGHSANEVYWFDIISGNWITSSFYADSLPQWVIDFNNKKFADTYMQNDWTTLLPITEYSASLLDNNDFETGIYGQKVFPYILKDISKKFDKKNNYEILKYTPFGDNLTKDFAISSIVGEELGKDEYTDVLNISFTVSERIGNLFGPLSVETEDIVLRLDKEIAHLLDFVDKTIGKENVLIYLTAEHGVVHIPEYLNQNKIPSGYFTSAGAISLLRSYMNNIYGKGDWIKQYHGQQIYLNRTLIEDAKLKLSDVQDKVANLMLQFSGVANTMTSTTLQSTNFTEGIFNTMQNGCNQKRSGDVVLNLRAGWAEKPDLNQGFAPAYGYDRRVPLIWYGWKIGRNTIHRKVDLTDIAPTICTLLEISYPNSATGSPILEIIEKK